MSDHVLSPRFYIGVFAALLLLLGVTVLIAEVHLGPFNTVVWVGIAGVKATLVALYFMHVRYSSRLTWAFAGASLLWFVILFGLTLTDYLTRAWGIA